MTAGLLNAELCSSSSVRCHLPYIIFVHVDCKIFNDDLQLYKENFYYVRYEIASYSDVLYFNWIILSFDTLRCDGLMFITPL